MERGEARNMNCRKPRMISSMRGCTAVYAGFGKMDQAEDLFWSENAMKQNKVAKYLDKLQNTNFIIMSILLKDIPYKVAEPTFS
jgi:hypothetical protein